MCGIAGIMRFSGSLHDSDVMHLNAMTKALALRGPDNQDVWHENNIGLGHRRLSILDLSDNGRQPMHSHNERYVIVYNGEIYNFEEIRAELIEKGIRFRSVSDTEVILESFNVWGIEGALPRFNGMFAIAVWDKVEKSLSLIRDQMGIKPLFWAKIRDGIIFASEIKALRQHSEFCKEINELALGDFFSRSFIAGSRTIYKNCFRLSPASFLSCNKKGEFSEKNFLPDHGISYDVGSLKGSDLINSFETEMLHAVNRHMRADVPVAAFLSGGNDSALICALLSKSKNFKTYSVGYAEKSYDESQRASDIASHLGLSHEVVMIEPSDAGIYIDKLSDIYDEPFADASALPTYLLSKHVSGTEKVALSGDGADELFAGYPRYMTAAGEWDRLRKIPRIFRPFLSSLIPHTPPAIVNNLCRFVLESPEKSLPYIKDMLAEASVFNFFHKKNYLGIEPRLALNKAMLTITDYDLAKFPSNQNSMRALLEMDQAVRLPDAMLTKVDRASMAASLEVRVPYLDREIIAFSRLLDVNQMVSKEGTCKKLIKDVLIQYLPSHIVNAPKSGFHIPMKLWLKTHFKDWACDLLSGADPYLDLPSVRQAWKSYAEEGRDDLFFELWCILMYRQWVQKAY